MLGIALSLLAALAWGTGGIFVRLGSLRLKASTGTFLSLLATLVAVVIAAIVFSLSDFASLSLVAIAWFGVAGVVNFRLGRHFNYAGIQRIGVSRASPIIAVSPLFALILAVSFLGEQVNILIVVGTLMIVAGLPLLVSKE